jgi:thioredoxin-dependent peroxiredoxin
LSLTLLTLALTLADAPKVEEGKPAPDFTLESVTDKGTKKVSLKDLKGKNVVLFFYPKAMTPGCTKESCGFSAVAKKFDELDTVVFGISTDNKEAQGKFIEKEKLEIPLLADPEKTTTKAYGALNEQRGAANRYTYVIDKQGNIAKIYKTVNPTSHPEEVLKYIKENLKK